MIKEVEEKLGFVDVCSAAEEWKRTRDRLAELSNNLKITRKAYDKASEEHDAAVKNHESAERKLKKVVDHLKHPQ